MYSVVLYVRKLKNLQIISHVSVKRPPIFDRQSESPQKHQVPWIMKVDSPYYSNFHHQMYMNSYPYRQIQIERKTSSFHHEQAAQADLQFSHLSVVVYTIVQEHYRDLETGIQVE